MRNHFMINHNYLVIAPDIPTHTRSQLRESHDLTCAMCGIAAGQIDSDTGLRALLHVKPGSYASRGSLSVQIACSVCLDGRKEMMAERLCAKPPAARIMRAGIDEQRSVYEWLRKKFKESLSMDRSENMRAIRGKDTQPELFVRSLIHRLGYRFRLHRSSLPGKPDLVFPARRKVIFVHGCFWHCHRCKNGLIPNTNRDFWFKKLRQNETRDAENQKVLRKLGWKVLVIWQCELKDQQKLPGKVIRFLGPARSTN
jgi:DNA mismatch endonuclease (patch repair protein)